eukprot:scaffold116609_cov39-Cyclotella_meneghiniana.AAC.1
MAVMSLLLTSKVGHSSEDFVRRGAFSGVSKFLCDKIFAEDPQVSWQMQTFVQMRREEGPIARHEQFFYTETEGSKC